MLIFMCFFAFFSLVGVGFLTRYGLRLTETQGKLDKTRDKRQALQDDPLRQARIPLPGSVRSKATDTRPVYKPDQPKGTCPDCGATAAHLLMDLDARSAARACVECAHEWTERVV